MSHATAKLFQNGRSQAVRLPKEFRFEGSEVSIRREGSAVVLEPAMKRRPATHEEVQAFFKEVDAFKAGPAIPGGRNQGELKPRKIFD